MLSHILVLVGKLPSDTLPALCKTVADAIAATSSTVSQHIKTSKYRFGPRLILHVSGLLPPHHMCSHIEQDDCFGLSFALIFTVLALFTFLCISSMICYTTGGQIHPDTARLHALERAITRQIEMNYHLSRPSQSLGLKTPNCNTADFEQWAVHWSDIKCLHKQAELDFKHGVSNWYYDDHPDCARRYHELRNELARLHSLGRNIVNAREEAKRYCGSAAGGRVFMGVNGKGWMRRKVETLEATQIDETDTRGQGKAVFQQQVDTVGRLTPGGRFG